MRLLGKRSARCGVVGEWAVVRIGQRAGVNADSLRAWVEWAAMDAGERLGTTTSDAKKIRVLFEQVVEIA